MNSTISLPASKEPIDVWSVPVEIARNNFKYKSLSCWSCNTAVGCEHGCTFCYVPEVSTRKLAKKLKEDHQVDEPDEDWGNYVMIRPYDESRFWRTLFNARHTSPSQLNADGNRAIMFCTTTDPYQVIRHKDPKRRKELQEMASNVMRKCLDTILEHSDLNVRILTRSPLAKQDFDLFKKFGKRLLFGMSIPTLDNRLAKIYEPHAPAPSARYETLVQAKKHGLNVYAAMAPTYPECERTDIETTLAFLQRLDLVTIFHEPINIRAGNIDRIAKQAKQEGFEFKRSIFASSKTQAVWAREQFMIVEQAAADLRIPPEILHLWPDQTLPRYLPEEQFWCEQHWKKVSAWPK